MRYLCTLFLLAYVIVLQLHSVLPVQAAESFSITNVTKFEILPLKRNTTLETVMGTINERIYIENIERQGDLGVVRAAPSDLLTILAGVEERIILENVEMTGVQLLTAVPDGLLTMIQNIVPRFWVENVEQLQIADLTQLVLEAGIPTTTRVRISRLSDIPTMTPTPEGYTEILTPPTSLPTPGEPILSPTP